MVINNAKLTVLEKLIASKNSIPLNEIEKIRVEKENGEEVIRCYLRIPERYDDGIIKLTDVKRKRKRHITGLGMYGVKFEIVFWVVYFYQKQKNANEKQKTMRYQYPEEIFYKGLEKSRYSTAVFKEVIKLHLDGLNNLEIIEHLKDEHGADISEGEIRMMLKFKANNIEIAPFSVKTIGVDEVKLKGINKTYVVLQDLDRACILGIAKGKKVSSVENAIDEVKKKEYALMKSTL